MSERDSAYTHRSDVVGSTEEKSPDPSKEHKESARGSASERNELTPDERGRTDGYGPRTHEDTRTVRKGQAD